MGMRPDNSMTHLVHSHKMIADAPQSRENLLSENPLDDDPDAWVVLSKSERRRRARARALPTFGETPEQTRRRRTQLFKDQALACGFSRVGVAQAQALPQAQGHLEAWLAAGMHGSMTWLADDVARRCDPRQVVPGAQSVVVLALDYDSEAPRTREVALQAEDRAWISRYAWGDDYHLIVERRLKRLEENLTAALKPELGEHFRGPDGPIAPFKAVRDLRWMVDYGPALEREWAVRAGIGWRGKHSLVLHPRHGSLFFLACIITSVDLEPDPMLGDFCGTCTACLDACPTQAIVAPYVVDARLCISHTTIETTGTIPGPERSLLGDQVFGCDICQDVCPWNRFSQPGDPAFAPRAGNLAPRVDDLLAMDAEAFARQFAQSAVKRRGLAGLQDNARAVRERR
jgi:epoxyqueuosine reductase